MGTCLSFVLVFKSNIAYNRHATARLTHTPWIRRRTAQTHTLDLQSRTALTRTPRSLAARRAPAARAFAPPRLGRLLLIRVSPVLGKLSGGHAGSVTPCYPYPKL